MLPAVLHISETDAGGGSAASAYRIHESLRGLGCRSRMLVGRRQTEDEDVRLLKRSTAWRAADRAFGEIIDRAGLQYVCYPSSFGLVRDPWFRAADVVQLYNTHGSYFSHTALPLISRRRPVVWRLSDMWAMTGHTAYAHDCERWRSGCGSCPYLDEYPSLRRDTTALLWRIKRATYARSRLTIVAPSRWIGRLAAESPLLGRFPIRQVPNGVDLELFRPRARAEAKRELGLDPSARVVLFSARRLDERRKGGALLAAALRELDLTDVELTVAGDGELERGCPARSLGRLSAAEMATAYAAADVYVHPATAENLSNTIIESIACGTPVVAFDVGGVSDAVRHLETGYLARLGDANDLGAGIRALLADTDLQARLAARCREVAVAEYGRDREARGMLEVYAELLAAT